MKWFILLIFLLIAFFIGKRAMPEDFDPNTLQTLTVIYHAPCEPYHCVILADENGTRYLFALNPETEEVLIIYKVTVNDQMKPDLELLWAKEMV